MRLQVILFFSLLLFSTNVFGLGVPSQYNIQYNAGDPTDLADWFNPNQYGVTCSGEMPLIIWAHGGGFTAGTKLIAYGLNPWKGLLQNCYAVVSIQYTLSPTQTYATNPTIMSDFQNAVAYFRNNASTYGIDANKIIAMGQSAGADVWMYPVYGPPKTINSQDTRPNYFISIAGWTDINAMVNTTTGALYGQTTLATVSVADKNAMSMIYMLDQNAIAFPNRIIPTLFLSNGVAGTPPINDPHDAYFGDLGLAKINQYNSNTGSADYNLSLTTDDTSYRVNWLDVLVGNVKDNTPSTVSFYDDFNGYTTNYASVGGYEILYDFNQQSGWTIEGDVNTGFFVPGFGGKLNGTAVSWPVDVDKNSGNLSTIYRNIPPTSVLRDWNAFGAKIYVAWKTDQNAQMAYIQTGLGQNNSNYEIWRKSGVTDWINPWPNGWFVTQYDLNSPFPGKVGSPSYVDVNFLRITVAHTGTQVDYNFTIDRIWIENEPNAFGDTWEVVRDGNQLFGWGMPFSDSTGTGIVVTDMNIIGTSNRGIVLLNEFEELDLTNYDYNITVDVNQVNTTGTKIFFDYVDESNYSSCYITDLNATGREVGVEQVVNGVSSSQSVDTNFSYFSKQTYICEVVGSVVSIYQNGTKLTFGTDFSRISGSFGLSSIGGTTKFQNYSVDLTLISSTPSDSEDAVFSSSLNSLSQVPGLLIIAGLILILIFGIYVLTNPNQSISLPTTTDNGVMIVVYVALAIIIILFTVIISSYAITIT